MNHDKVNMLSTATIAFVTVLVAMGGFYFNLVDKQAPVWMIATLEATLLLLVLLFIRWIYKRGEA